MAAGSHVHVFEPIDPGAFQCDECHRYAFTGEICAGCDRFLCWRCATPRGRSAVDTLRAEVEHLRRRLFDERQEVSRLQGQIEDLQRMLRTARPPVATSTPEDT